uniref:Uncharacterized protein n=1 Tax=Panagrolaimus sp. PS1159 TaxID=55785 RepID=A0AC35GT83_9BILA
MRTIRSRSTLSSWIRRLKPDTASLGLGSSRRAPSSMSLMEEGTRPFPRHAPNLANLRSYSIQASTGSLLSPSSSRKRPEFNQ